MTIAFPAPPSTTAPLSQEIRIVGRKHSLQGAEFKIAIGQRYFWVGSLTLDKLQAGYCPEDFALTEIDPDAPDLEDY